MKVKQSDLSVFITLGEGNAVGLLIKDLPGEAETLVLFNLMSGEGIRFPYVTAETIDSLVENLQRMKHHLPKEDP